MATTARVHSAESAHWYTQIGEPAYEKPKKDGSGMRAVTLADARKENLLPSVTSILSILDKPQLNDWKVEQGVLAVLTTPRKPGEADDAFVHRVLHEERVQDQEAQTARDRGTEIHAAMEDYFLGKEILPELRPWIEPAAKAVAARGELVTAEKILVGDGYAGKVDLIQKTGDFWWITDWKTCRTMPDPKKGAYFEHRLQAAAYAAAYYKKVALAGVENWQKPIRTCNVYISTLLPGSFTIIEHVDRWDVLFERGFMPLFAVWKLLKNYYPTM